ncbi:MAG: hypothetical protein H8E26_03890 [FCB group bacterium]|nr:hypothetical protein [FCB group bacterium]MBL7028277.1 hypothetical protein [Candidatus Neomarinimicrobiota bacterium]
MNMDDPIIIALIVAGSIAVIAAIVMLVRYYEKKRTEALRTAAAEMRLEFSRLPDPQLLPSLRAFPLFSQGHSKKAFNVMSGMADEIEITMFDYSYTTGGGKNQHTHNQTVVLLKSSLLDIPPFSLKPQNVFHSIGKAFGYQDINFDSHPIFSEKYLLRSTDELVIREFFTAAILEYFEQRHGLSTEAGGDRLIFFRASKKVKPEDLPAFLKDGFHIYTLIK